jgi:uncharacterized glyoxalase superfamily protein PhnB
MERKMEVTMGETGERFRVGMRVADPLAAASFFGGLGFTTLGEVPGPDGRPVLVAMRRGEATLILDALVGMPFPDTARERQVQTGPRGLGVVFGLEVADLDAAYTYCRAAGCTITAELEDAPWGERVFTFLDPFGYEWEFFQPIPGAEEIDGTVATHDAWFGGVT